MMQESKESQISRSGDRVIAAMQEADSLRSQLEKAVAEASQHKARMMALEIKVSDQKLAFKESKAQLKQELTEAQAEVSRAVPCHVDACRAQIGLVQ